MLAALALLATLSFDGYWQGAAIKEGGVRIYSLEILQFAGKKWAIVDSPDYGWSDAQEVPAQESGDTLTFTLQGTPFKLTREGEEATGTMGSDIRLQFKRALKPPEPAVLKQEVSFRSGGETIAGTLVSPLTRSRHGAVLYLPGRGTTERQGFKMAARFAMQGAAMFITDRRGSGKSTGGPETIQSQIQDGVSAVNFLAARQDIDPSKIGIYSESAGGWVAPFVATKSRVSFLMLSVCPAESVEQQQLTGFELALRKSAQRLSEEEVGQGMEFVRLMLDHALRGTPRTKLDEAYATVSKTRFAAEAEATPEDLADNLDWIRRHSIDPAEAWRKVTAPVLALYGSADNVVESSKNAALLRQYLEAAGNKDITIRTVPNATHGLRLPGRTQAIGGQPLYSWPHMPTEVPEAFLDWCATKMGA